MRDAISEFLARRPFAVCGATADRAKFGNRVLRHYLERDLPVWAVNPRGGVVEGLPVYASLAALPERPGAVSIVTPPAVTAEIVAEALELGIDCLWMQPGAEHPEAIAAAIARGATVIHGGPCVLVELA